MTAGSMIGMFLVTLAVVPMATRFGIDSIATTKPQFGSRGWMIAAVLQYISIIGWNSLLLIFFGKSVTQLLMTLGVMGEGASAYIVPLMSAVACAIVYGTLLRGATGIERVSKILFAFIIGVSLWMVVMLLTQQSGAIALLFVIAANLGTAVIGVYASAVGLRHLPVMNALPWKWVLTVALMPVAAVGIALPELFFNSFGTFLAFIGVMFAPLCGIQIVDYYFLRKQQISIRGIYDPSPDAPYFFWRGFNPAAFLAMAAGFGVYVYLLHPVSYVSHAPYQYLTASLPTFFVGGVSYWIFTATLNLSKGVGGYKTASQIVEEEKERIAL
ncbi:MAG: cytosine permease [Cyanobacteria bacterium P01_G01_bin.38]